MKLGVIGGSGIYDIDGVESGSSVLIDTPYGAPSHQIFTGTLNGLEVAFRPRHGHGHIHNPSHVPYQSNIYALKSIGVTDILAVSAKQLLKRLTELLPSERVPCWHGCDTALEYAIITDRPKISEEERQRLSVIA